MSRIPDLVVDTSAVIAILLEEDGFRGFNRRLDEAERLWIRAPTLVEAGIVLIARFESAGLESLFELVHRVEISIVNFDRMHFIEAAEAFRRFGKGRHPAKLNLGDCHSYAVAKLKEAPLLYKGDDFILTDLPKLA